MSSNAECDQQEFYVPDEMASVIYLKCNFHFIYFTEEDPRNFISSWDGLDLNNLYQGVPMNGNIWVEQTVLRINQMLESNEVMNLPDGFDMLPVLDYNFRIVNKGVYFHQDENLFKGCNGDMTQIAAQYSVNPESEINIFFTNPEAECSPNIGGNCVLPGDECFCSGCGWGGAANGMGGTRIIMKQDYAMNYKQYGVEDISSYNSFEEMVNWRVPARLLLHEILHCFNLGHTILTASGSCSNNNDFCNDTPTRNEWLNATGNSPCCDFNDTSPFCSNNLMDYQGGKALTPCQIGRVLYFALNDHIRYVDFNCNVDDSASITIANGSNLVWNNSRVVTGNIIIEDGGSLTVKCKLFFPLGSFLLVNQGGKLIVDGGVLTSSCGDLWEGITVLGNTNQSQQLPGMGIVELKNGAIIENAVCGITVGEKVYTSHINWYWGNTGGIVKANDSYFLNNKCDVIFHPYQNFNPQTQVLIRNRSYFKDCTFEVSREVYNTQNFEQRVRLNCIDGIRFTACRFAFSDEALDVYNIEDRGTGLYTIQSSYEVTGRCSALIPIGGECEPDEIIASTLGVADSDIVPSRFEYFNQAIKSSANGPIPSTVQMTLFEENKFGIYMLNMQNPKIERNKFLILNTGQRTEYGLHLEGCSGYKVQRNYFEGDGDDDAFQVGSYITNSGELNNETYLNDYENLFAGAIAQGQNGDYLFPNNGLEILCGKYEQVKYNIAALNLDGLNAKLAYRQGDNAENQDDFTAPAGNLFDEYNATGEEENDFFVDNETVYSFTYEHHNEDSPFPVVPVEIDPDELTTSENIPLFEDRNQCCPKDRSNEENPNSHLDLVLVKRLQIKDLEDDLSGLMDGGNSEIITDFVQNPLHTSAEVRMNLLPLSPYLSDQVLIAALKREPALNPWHLCEILISCSPLSSKTWLEVENNTTMSEYMYQLLVEYQNGTNGRWTKEMEIKRLAKEKALSERAYTYWAFNDSTDEYHLEPYKDMMTGDEINRSIRMRFSLLIKEKNYNQALVIMEDYEGGDGDHWVQVAELICALDSGKYSNVDREAMLTQLEGFANRETEAGRSAWSYLELFDRGELDQKLLLPTPGTRSKKLRSDKRALLSDVYPNPGNDYIYITFVLPEERENATVVVYDLGGRQVFVSDITKVHGILEMNSSTLATGQYIYEINLEGKSVSNGKFVVQH